MAAQQVAGAARLNHLPVALRHRAFVTRSIARGYEYAGNALNLFDRAINPRPVHAKALAIDRKARLAIVESADHHVGPAKNAGAKIMDDVTVEIANVDLRINFLRGSRGDLGLGFSGIRLAIKD